MKMEFLLYRVNGFLFLLINGRRVQICDEEKHRMMFLKTENGSRIFFFTCTIFCMCIISSTRAFHEY